MTKLILSSDQIADAQRMATTPDLPNFSLPGTGKTHTTLEAIKLAGYTTGLFVCPKIALYMWQKEASEWLGADVSIMKTANTPLVGDFIVTTYGIANNARERLYERFDGGCLTLDESQYAANPEAARTQAIFGQRADLVGGLAERFDTAWCLSGTPMQNFANDYYTQAAVLHPEIFAAHGIHNYDDFCRKFTYKQKRQYHPRMQPTYKIVGSTNEGLLGNILYNEIGAVKRISSDGMPALRVRTLEVDCRLPKEVMREMAGLTEAEIIGMMNDPDSIVAKVWKMIGLAKVAQVIPYLGDSVKDSPVLLGCWHHDVMQAYSEELEKAKIDHAVVSGKTSDTQRELIRKRFNAGELPVLIGQMRAMGVSWNIQEASNHVIIAEEHPAHSVIEQFYKRVYRRGQTKACLVDVILGKDMSVDTAFNNVRQRKEESNEKIG